MNITDEIKNDFKEFNQDKSIASYALRFTASHKNVKLVLSGISNLEDMIDNCKTFTNFKPLTNEELEFLKKESKKIRKTIAVPCTSCNYCLEHCPEKIQISKFFNLYNNVK